MCILPQVHHRRLHHVCHVVRRRVGEQGPEEPPRALGGIGGDQGIDQVDRTRGRLDALGLGAELAAALVVMASGLALLA